MENSLVQKVPEASENTFVREPDISHNVRDLAPHKNRPKRDSVEFHSQTNPLIQQEPEDTKDVMIMCGTDELAKLFFKQTPIVWYNPKIDSEENTDYLKQLRSLSEVQTFSNYKDALDFIQRNQTLNYYIITSGEDGEPLIQAVTNEQNVLYVYVLCDDVTLYEKWIEEHAKVKSVETEFNRLMAFIKKDLIRIDFPAFGAVFNDADTSKMNKLHHYLKGFMNFRNRKQAKNDLLALAAEIYNDGGNMIGFENEYNEYTMHDTFDWYTRESFFYKILNNCLRIKTADSILYSRLIVKDLETAIKEYFQKKSRHFSGLLYKGCYLSDEEWTGLEKNTGKEIEMFGFLSTSKDRKIGVKFTRKDPTKKALITIIVPSVADLDVRGFAEIKDFSNVPDEEEVLFNIRSRFTILETKIVKNTKKCNRHLTLLYVIRAIRKHISGGKPEIKISLHGIDQLKCKECRCMISDPEGKSNIMYVNLDHKNEYICQKCMEESIKNKINPYLCVFLEPKDMQSSPDRTISIKGETSKYEQRLDVPFYGSECSRCRKEAKQIDSYRFICSDCDNKKKVWCCHDCLNADNECIRSKHTIILETCPFTFWNEKMSREDSGNAMYWEHQMEQESVFEQGKAFLKADKYESAKLFYEEMQKRYKEEISFESMLLYGGLGQVHEKLGDYRKSIEFYSRSLDVAKVIYGEQHPYTATVYNNLGLVNLSLGDYQKAMDLFTTSLKLKIAAYTEQHFEVSTTYSNLAWAYYCLGDCQKAVELYLQSLNITKKIFGEHHPDTARSCDNLGAVYRSLGQYQKAIKLHSQSLDITKVVFGEQHQNTMMSCSNLASVHYALGDIEKAMELFSKSLEIAKVVFGEQHPFTATIYNDLACVYYSLKNYPKAIELHLKCIEIKKVALGEQHSEIATSYSNLAAIYHYSGDYPKAVDLYSKSLDITKTLFGEQHRDTARLYNNLGSLYKSMEEYEKAIQFYLQSLEIRKKVFGEHPDIVDSYSNIASVYESLKDYQKAMEFYSQSLDTAKTVLGEQDPKVGTLCKDVGFMSEKLEDYHKALKFYLQSLVITKATSGEQHSDTLALYDNIGSIYKRLGDYQKAIDFFSQSLDLRKKVFLEPHQDLTTSYNNLGSTYFSLKDYQKAIELFSESLTIAKVVFGEQDFTTAGLYKNLGLAFETVKDYDKAIEFYSKSLEIKKSLLGEYHLNLIEPCNSLASVYSICKNYKKAAEVSSGALDIAKVVLGEQHKNTGRMAENLACIYIDLGDYQRAIELYVKSVDIKRLLLGDCNQEVAVSYTHLATLYTITKDYQKAAELYLKSLEITKMTLGNQHERTAVTCEKLGGIYKLMGDHQKANEFYLECLEIRKVALGGQHPDMVASAKKLEEITPSEVS